MTNSRNALCLGTILAAALAGIPATAAAGTVICATFPVWYQDSNLEDFTEDYWVEMVDTPRPLRGVAYTVNMGTHPFTQVSSGYLTESGTAGCTPDLALGSGIYTFQVKSKSRVNSGNIITVTEPNGLPAAMTAFNLVPSTLPQTVNFAPDFEDDEWNEFNILQAATWAIYHHGGGISGELWSLSTFDDIDPPCGSPPDAEMSCWDGSTAWLSFQASSRKFVIVHELGHQLGDLRGIPSPGTFGYNGAGGCVTAACGGTGVCGVVAPYWQHKSLEWAATAMWEGFAEFYSMDTWNDHDETDCAVDHNEVGVFQGADCEGNATWEAAWANGNTCRNPDDPGSGSVVDWMRMFWDVHTNGAAPDPSFTAIARDWLYEADPWNHLNTFDKIEDQAVVEGGDLLTNWRAAVCYHAPYYYTPAERTLYCP